MINFSYIILKFSNDLKNKINVLFNVINNIKIRNIVLLFVFSIIREDKIALQQPPSNSETY